MRRSVAKLNSLGCVGRQLVLRLGVFERSGAALNRGEGARMRGELRPVLVLLRLV